MSETRAIVSGLPGEHLSRRKALKQVAKEEHVLHSHRWLFAYIIIELTCQVALLFPTFAVMRVFVRSAAYLSSILLLVVLRRGPIVHPSAPYAMVAIAIVTISLAHPYTNTLGGGLATIALSTTIFGPLMWGTRIKLDVQTVRTVFLIYWAFNSMSAVFGTLQIYFPGRFEPVVSTAWSENVLQGLNITLADGTRVPRPMGLTDSPGGASVGGAFAIIFAVAFLLDRPNLIFRLLLLASVGFSCFTIYLSQVRSMLVMALIALVAMGLPLLYQRRAARYLANVVPMALIAVLSFGYAVAIGGQSVVARLDTLVDNDAGTVYYSNRGIFFSHTFNDLLQLYPLGAGTGRHGMTYVYFGDPYNVDAKPLWSEIQWTSWLYDGGVPLMIASALALAIAFRTALQTAKRVDDRPGRDLHKWATMLVGYDVGMIALIFSGCPFETTMGIDFWLLNAIVYAASQQLQTA